MNAIFRIARTNDAAEIAKIYSPFCESTHVSFEEVPPNEAQTRERIERVLGRHPWLVAEVDTTVAGYVYAAPHRERAAYRWGVDVAVYIGADFRRQGLGRSLYGSLFTILRAQGFYKAIAGIALPNAGSVGLHESLGFRRVALFSGEGYKLGQWHDVGWWQLDLQPEVDRPAEPLPFRDIRDSDAVRAALADAVDPFQRGHRKTGSAG